MRLLFVDDHEEFVRTVRDVFLRSHEVDTATSLSEAVKALAAKSFDVILLDYDLPDGKGVTLLANLSPGSATKVVAVSAHNAGNSALLRAGADVACAKANFAEIGSVLRFLAAPP